MNDRSPARRAQARGGMNRGFTLMELLLAMVVFAVVLTAINGVFFGAMRLRNKTAATLDAAAPVHAALNIIRRDLLGIQLPGGRFTGILNSLANITTEEQVETGTEIFTNTGMLNDLEPWGEIQRVAYVLRQPTNQVAQTRTTGRDLVRVLNRNLLPPVMDEPREQRLLPGVDLLEFSFFDGMSWRTAWNSTNDTTTLPRAIRVTLTMARENADPNRRVPIPSTPQVLQVVVPVTLTPVTNSTPVTTATGGGA